LLKTSPLLIYYSYYIFFIILLGASNQVIAETKNIYFSIGIEIKKSPYSYMKENGEISGILVERIKFLCKQSKMECHFVTDSMENLLSQLKTLKIQAVLVQDSFVMSEIDKIILSSPLCKISPTFIQRKTAPIKSTMEVFKGVIIGVKKNSVFHIYLLDNYNKFSDMKPYIQLESGIFDLLSKRIDVLFADDAFFDQRIFNTSLNSNKNPNQLIRLNMEKLLKSDPIFNETMSLAFRKDNEKYIDIFKILLDKSTPIFCVDLLKNSQTISPENQNIRSVLEDNDAL